MPRGLATLTFNGSRKTAVVLKDGGGDLRKLSRTQHCPKRCFIAIAFMTGLPDH